MFDSLQSFFNEKNAKGKTDAVLFIPIDRWQQQSKFKNPMTAIF